MENQLLVLLFVLTLFNCKSDKDKTRLNSLTNFEDTLLKEYILPQDSVIYFESDKGLKLKFSPNDLEDYNSGNLKLQLTELNSTQDLLLANAQTVSNGKWLVSSGAFKLNILNEDGKTLQLKKDKTITVDFKQNTSGNEMEIFYGEVESGDMNWKPTDVEIKDKEIFFILYQDSTILDKKLTKKYGEVDVYRSAILIDTFGIIPYDAMRTEIEEFILDKDTLRIYQEYIYGEKLTDEQPTDEELTDENNTIITSITKQKADSIINTLYKLYFENGSPKTDSLTRKSIIISRSRTEETKQIDFEKIIAEKKLKDKNNEFYKSIELPKLGWVNIDKYAKIENKETISFAFKDEFDARKLTLIDTEDNTIVNFYKDNIELPKGKTFTILAFGLKSDVAYGYKKTFRVTKNTTINIDLKKVNKSQIKALMALN